MHYRTMTINDYEAAIAYGAKVKACGCAMPIHGKGEQEIPAAQPRPKLCGRSRREAGGNNMAGHDGKRGYVQHLSVSDAHHRLGIATPLVSQPWKR